MESHPLGGHGPPVQRTPTDAGYNDIVAAATPGRVVQREPAKKPARRDLVVITSSDLGGEASVLAPEGTVIRVKSLKDLAAKLRGVDPGSNPEVKHVRDRAAALLAAAAAGRRGESAG